MGKNVKKVLSILLCTVIIAAGLPLTYVYADSVVEIYNGDTIVTEQIALQEYRNIQLSAVVADGTPEGYTVSWESNLPLLADVDNNGKVTAYDYSKRAVIQLWIDENIASLPLIGSSLAASIWNTIDSSGIDVDNTDTDTIVTIVSAVVGEELGESLRKALNNMNVKITATVAGSDGKVLGTDTVEVVVEKSVIANVAPTGVHITNKKVIPKTVAVGATVQLFGACTPVRLGQGIKWSVGSSAFDTSASEYASVSSDGLVTFKKAGTVTVRVNPESNLYAAFSDTVTFTVLEQQYLPLTDFTINGSSSIAEGATTQLTVSNITPAGAYWGDLHWMSSDPTIAVVDENGLVTGLDGGSGTTYSKTVSIVATAGGYSKEFPMKVTRTIISSLSSVEISGYENLGIGSTETLTADVFPTRLNTSSSVTRNWGIYNEETKEPVFATSSSPVANNIASIDSAGNITGISTGVVTVYCVATYGSSQVYDTFEVSVGKAITDFTIVGTASLKEGNTSQLSITVNAPSDYDKDLLNNIKWSVEDSNIATVSDSGVFFGRDAGGRALTASQSTTIYATISGVTKSLKVTVTGQGTLAINKYTDAEIIGTDYVIVDLPRTFSLTTYPSRIGTTDTYWGVNKDDGSAPWTASLTLGDSDTNLENTASTVTSSGTVSAKSVGSFSLYGFRRYLASTYIDTHKDIAAIEVAPKSITITPPTKTEYLEGNTDLDLTGLEVHLTYDKTSISEYYPDAASYTDEQLTAKVTDYTVSAVNTSVLDSEQYIIVSVTRAGKTMNAVFPITVISKDLTSVDVTAPTKYEYFEGETELDTAGLSVVANYSNSESEGITDYNIDYSTFNPNLFDVEQNVSVSYTHAGKTATGTFPVIVYGKPELSVQVNGTVGSWTSSPITFTFTSTHELNGATYYYRTEGSDSWVMCYKNTFTASKSINTTYYFKAVNSKKYSSDESDGYVLMIDTVSPLFSLSAEKTTITNEDYNINIKNLTYGESGLKSLTLNGVDITGETYFTVSENGAYTVKATSNNGLYLTQTINVTNIDKIAPVIDSATVTQEPEDAAFRIIDAQKFNKYYSGNLVAEITYHDNVENNIASIKYRLVDEKYNPINDWAVYTDESKATCSSNFKGYFEFVVTDKAGNSSESYFTEGIIRDGIKPVISNIEASCGDEPYTNNSWADDAVRFTPEATAFSGIYEYLYRMDNGSWQNFNTDYIEVTDDGTHTYYFKAVSYSGLESDIYEFTVNIDRTIPTIRVDFEGTFGRWTSEDVRFTLSTLNVCPSGVTYYYECGNGWQEIDGNTAVFSENTNTRYRFKAVNGAGLESTPSDYFKVMIDTESPDATVIQGVTDKTSTPYQIAISPTGGSSGIKKVYFDGEDVSDTLTATVSKNGKYILTVIGNNLISTTKVIQISNFGVIPADMFTYTNIDEATLNIVSYNGKDEIINVPFEANNRDILGLSTGAFSGNTAIKEVSLPNGLTSIGSVCFLNCTSLTKITIPETVTTISDLAFSGCTNLTIYCYSGSYAESYAIENNIPYVLLELKPVGKTEVDEKSLTIYTLNTSCTSVNQIISGGDEFHIIGIPSKVIGNNEIFGTGSTIYFFKNGQLTYTYTLVVRGDVDGDGAVDVLDAFATQKASTQQTALYDANLLAADFDTSGEVEAIDYQCVINTALI